MWNFSLAQAVKAMLRTWPFILLRVGVYFGIALLYIVVTGTGGSIGLLLSSSTIDNPVGAFYGGLVGFAGASGLLYWAREYVLYLVKAGHLSVLVALYDGASVPAGTAMIGQASGVVRQRFAQSSALFGMDQLLKGVLRAIAGSTRSIASLLPVPYLDRLVELVNHVLRMSLTFADEVVLAYLLRQRSDNDWLGARDAVVLYAQNYRHLLKNALWLCVFVWLLSIAVFVVLLAPAAALIAFFPLESSVWPIVLALLLTWSFKQALIEPLAMHALLQVFLRVTEGQAPDPALSIKLDKLSSSFRELGQRAQQWLPDSIPGSQKVQA